MNLHRLPALLFLAVALVQLALPAHRMWQYQRTLREGKPFKFRTAPVDPYDAFRGRYVTLRYEENSAEWSGGELSVGKKAWVRVESGADGFAHFTTASPARPAEGDYLEVTTGWGSAPGRANLQLPFDRFYMEETVAPEAERLFAERNRSAGARDAYALVRIRAGLGVIEQVFVGQQTLAAAAKELIGK